MPSEVFTEIWNLLNQYNLLPLIVAIIVLAIVYYTLKVVLSRFRSRGVISKGTEEALRFASLTVLALIIFAIAISLFLQVYLLAIAFIALLIMFIGMIMYAVRTYVENAISYMLFVASNVVRDGDLVEIVTDNSVYKGRITIAEGGYVVIDSGGSRTYIPYSTLMRSVITKIVQNSVNFVLRVRGQGLELVKVVNDVKDILSEVKVINRENVRIKPLTIKDNEIALSITVELLNPRNIDECYESVSRLLSRKFPYSFSLEFQ